MVSRPLHGHPAHPDGVARTAVGLVAPVVTVVVAVTLQFPGDADATAAQEALGPSAEHWKRAEKRVRTRGVFSFQK